MIVRITMLLLIVVSGTAAWSPAQSGPTQKNLKLAHESFVASINSGYLKAAQAMIHPDAIGFFRNSVKIVELRSDYGAAEALPTVIEDLSKFDSVPVDTVYRVVGNTGIVCMASKFQAKKWSKEEDYSARSTYIYVIMNGNWRLISWHTSNAPLKK